MKHILIALLLTACASTPPNKTICVTDAPRHAHCAFMIQGNDFEVDNIGHNFTQDGRNWSYDQLMKYELIMPPDSYKAVKEWFLNWCHQHQGKCTYTQAVDNFNRLEEAMQFKLE